MPCIDDLVEIKLLDASTLQGKSATQLSEYFQQVSNNWSQPVVFRGAIHHELSPSTLRAEFDPELLESVVDFKRCEPEKGGIFDLVFGQAELDKCAFKDFIDNEQLPDSYMTLGATPYMNQDFERRNTSSRLVMELRRVCGNDTVFRRITSFDEDSLLQAFIGNITTDYADPYHGYTGSPWHACYHRNIFLQVLGHKKWEFMSRANDAHFADMGNDPYCSILGSPPVEGIVTSVVLSPGDILLNPVCLWHKVLNAKGFNLAFPIKLEGSRNALVRTVKFALMTPENHSQLRSSFLALFPDEFPDLPEELLSRSREEVVVELTENRE